MKTQAPQDIHSTGKAPRRDSRDWRYGSEGRKTRKPQPRRQSTRQAVLQAYGREGGLR